MIRYKKYQVTGEDDPAERPLVCTPRNRRNLRHRKIGQAHVQSQHPLFEWCHQGGTGRHGFLHQRIDSGRQEREPDDLAIFSVGIVSKKGAQSAADFSLANNVKGLKLRARATGELSNAQINLDGQLKEIPCTP